MFTRAFAKDTAERVIASAAGGFLTVASLDAFDVLSADWKTLLSVSAGTGLISLAKALVASKLNDPDSASLVDLPGKHAVPEL
jgi:hypothetical protein